MDLDESSASGNISFLDMQPATATKNHPKDVLADFNDMPVPVRSFDGEEETFLALKQLEDERQVQVSGCFQKYVSFRPYIVAWIYDTCLRCWRASCFCCIDFMNDLLVFFWPIFEQAGIVLALHIRCCSVHGSSVFKNSFDASILSIDCRCCDCCCRQGGGSFWWDSVSFDDLDGWWGLCFSRMF